LGVSPAFSLGQLGIPAVAGDGVRIEIDGAVAVVTIDRPERRNSVDRSAADALIEAFRRFEADDSLSVAILTGAGETFCAGADLTAIAEGRGLDVTADGEGPMGPTRMQLGKPVLAAIEGHAVAGGLELALWCDLRVAARDAVLGFFNRRFGVPLIDLGTVRLPRLIGQSRALDLILTGRAVGAEEALAIGLVNRVVDSGQALVASLELARQLADHPQAGLRNDRLSVLEQWGLTGDAAMLNELRLGVATLASGEAVEGAKRFAAGEGRHGSS
jgi:enoyl-CoA hydratase